MCEQDNERRKQYNCYAIERETDGKYANIK